MTEVTIHICDVLEGMSRIPTNSIDCIVTSPPYWGLRDYGVADQWGLEPTLEEFLQKLDLVFAECWRVLKKKGTMWINMGDCYSGSWGGQGGASNLNVPHQGVYATKAPQRGKQPIPRKCLYGQPWRLAFRLIDAGWILRRDIIWEKTTAMPESAKDRPTTSHDYIFFLTKTQKYFYDYNAVKEPTTGKANARGKGTNQKAKRIPENWQSGPGSHSAIEYNKPGNVKPKQNASFSASVTETTTYRNLRSVWSFPTEPYPGDHYATFPPELPKRCILADCPQGGTVLDPFAGSGTTLMVAYQLGRNAIGIDINPANEPQMRQRLATVTPCLFSENK